MIYYERDGITIYHGDCQQILPQLGPVDLILTDPPYGIGLNYGTHDDSPEIYWDWFLPILAQMQMIAPVVMTHRQEAVRWITDWDHLAVWNKPMAFGYAISGWLAHWEPIFVFGTSPSFVAKVKPAKFDVFTHNTAPNKTGHPCPKPLDLMIDLLQTFAAETILDPFMGSGTTLVAAKRLGRRAIGIEIEEKYCEMAAQRLEAERLTLFEYAGIVPTQLNLEGVQ